MDIRSLPTKTKGEIAEQVISTTLMLNGWKIAKPLGDNQRFDLIIWQDSNDLKRVQCKLARKPVGEEYFVFPTSSVRVNSKGYVRTDYHGDVDFIAVWSPELDKCYLVPIEVCGEQARRLRLTGSRYAGSLIASDYEILPLSSNG